MSHKDYNTSKVHAMRSHTRRRFQERYGMKLNRHHRRELAELVLNSKYGKYCPDKENMCRLVMVQTNRISIYDITYYGRTFRMVWDRWRKEFATALAPNMLPTLDKDTDIV